MKKAFAVLISATLLLSAVIIPSGAYSEAEIPQYVTAGEKLLGGLGNLFGRFLKVITGTDESRIEKAKPVSVNVKEYDGAPLFDGEAEQSLTAETWRVVEIVYESNKDYEKPFEDAELDLTLCGNGVMYKIPGFWDGGNTWKVRFVCPSAGKWQFKTVCSDETNAGLHGRTGEVECSEYRGDLEIYKHGFVTTRYAEKYLKYDDGKPFYYLGDTHWSLGDETVDMVSEICAKRAEQGFTVFQSQPIGCKYDLTDGIDEDDIADLKIYDEKFQIIADAGLTHSNSQFFWPLAGMSKLVRNNGGWTEPKLTGYVGTKKMTMPDLSDGAKAYLESVSRFWVARYSAYPAIWSLGQEVDNDPYQDENSEWNAVNNPYKYVAEYLAKHDPYSHPVTAHQESTGVTACYGNGLGTGEVKFPYYPGAEPSSFRNVAAHSMYAAQWHPDMARRDDYLSARDYWYNSNGKPTVNYEGLYCYLWTKNFGARAQAWASYLSGLYGCSWGGQDTWSYTNSYDEDRDSDDGVDTITSQEKKDATWRDSLEYPSTYQVGYMRSFMEDIEWYDLIPRFNNLSYFVPCSNVYNYFASNKKNTEIVIYFYSFTDEEIAQRSNTEKYGGILTGTVGSLVPFAEYNYKWFDPVNGKYLDGGSFKASLFGTHFIGAKPDDTDMVLLIQKA